MSEVRRLKMKIGDAEFEADVPESKVQPMYDRFLSVLERQRTPPAWQFEADGLAAKKAPNSTKSNRDGFEEVNQATAASPETGEDLLGQVFHLRPDGAVLLKALPIGPDQHADALLLLLYGYHLVKKEECVMATELNRAAEQSGISVRRLANGYARNGRYVVRGGQRKGSHYALNSDGHAIAKDIMAKMFRPPETVAQPATAEVLAANKSANAPSWRMAPGPAALSDRHRKLLSS